MHRQIAANLKSSAQACIQFTHIVIRCYPLPRVWDNAAKQSRTPWAGREPKRLQARMIHAER
jgi:hypothetical protein